MNAIEHELLDSLYFVTAYEQLIKDLPWDRYYEEALINMLGKGWIAQMEYKHSDFVQKKPFNKLALHQYSYLATKKGLLVHAGL